jgi:hypothetical protein
MSRTNSKRFVDENHDLYINIFLIVETRGHFAGTFAVASMFGGVASGWMCAVEEHTGVGPADKASPVRC